MKDEYETCEYCMHSIHVGEIFQCELQDNNIVDSGQTCDDFQKSTHNRARRKKYDREVLGDI
jgi:hypothetical protein